MNFQEKYHFPYENASENKTMSRRISTPVPVSPLITGPVSCVFPIPVRINTLPHRLWKSCLRNCRTGSREQGGAASQTKLSNLEAKIFDVSKEIARLEDQIKSIQTQYAVLSIDDLAQSQQTLMDSLNEQLMSLDLQISRQTNNQSSYSPLKRVQ